MPHSSPTITTTVVQKLHAWSARSRRRIELKAWLRQWSSTSTSTNPSKNKKNKKHLYLPPREKSHRLKQKYFQFFALPLSLRQKVYHHTFVKPNNTPIKIISHLNRRIPSHREYLHSYHATLNTFTPLLTSRQFHAEANPIAYSRNTFQFAGLQQLEQFVMARVSPLQWARFHGFGRGVVRGRSPLKLMRKIKIDLPARAGDYWRSDLRSLLYPPRLRLQSSGASLNSPGGIQEVLSHLPGLVNLEISAWVYSKKTEVLVLVPAPEANQGDGEGGADKKLVKVDYLWHNHVPVGEEIQVDEEATLTEIKFLYRNLHFKARGLWVRFGNSGVKGKVDMFAYKELRKQFVPFILAEEFGVQLAKQVRRN